jgi:hypothetical protein
VHPQTIAPQVRTTPHVGDVVHYTEPGALRCAAAIVTAVGAAGRPCGYGPSCACHVDGTVALDVRWAPDMIRQPEDELVGVRYDPGTYNGGERQSSLAGGPLPLITCDDLTFEGCTWHFIASAP